MKNKIPEHIIRTTSSIQRIKQSSRLYDNIDLTNRVLSSTNQKLHILLEKDESILSTEYQKTVSDFLEQKYYFAIQSLCHFVSLSTKNPENSASDFFDTYDISLVGGEMKVQLGKTITNTIATTQIDEKKMRQIEGHIHYIFSKEFFIKSLEKCNSIEKKKALLLRYKKTTLAKIEQNQAFIDLVEKTAIDIKIKDILIHNYMESELAIQDFQEHTDNIEDARNNKSLDSDLDLLSTINSLIDKLQIKTTKEEAIQEIRTLLDDKYCGNYFYEDGSHVWIGNIYNRLALQQGKLESTQKEKEDQFSREAILGLQKDIRGREEKLDKIEKDINDPDKDPRKMIKKEDLEKSIQYRNKNVEEYIQEIPDTRAFLLKVHIESILMTQKWIASAKRMIELLGTTYSKTKERI